jgi:hypothetical protein
VSGGADGGGDGGEVEGAPDAKQPRRRSKLAPLDEAARKQLQERKADEEKLGRADRAARRAAREKLEAEGEGEGEGEEASGAVAMEAGAEA